MNIEEKIKQIVETEIEYAEKNGSTMLSTANHRHWDKDVWNYREQIIQAIRDRGYDVSVSVNHGVIDITTTKKLNL